MALHFKSISQQFTVGMWASKVSQKVSGRRLYDVQCDQLCTIFFRIYELRGGSTNETYIPYTKVPHDTHKDLRLPLPLWFHRRYPDYIYQEGCNRNLTRHVNVTDSKRGEIGDTFFVLIFFRSSWAIRRCSFSRPRFSICTNRLGAKH